MILITPDGERTMNTYLGACQALGPDDIDPDVVGRAAITYLEGYLWDPPEAKKAFVRAAEIAHAAGRKVSLTLSDAFCVDRYRAEFLDLIRSRHRRHPARQRLGGALALRDCRRRHGGRGAQQRLRAGRGHHRRRGGAGGDAATATVKAPATPVETVVDLTGAGDLFAAGFLFGVARGMDARRRRAAGDAGRIGGDRPHRPAAGVTAHRRGARGRIFGVAGRLRAGQRREIAGMPPPARAPAGLVAGGRGRVGWPPCGLTMRCR